jgi:hypothetical protein
MHTTHPPETITSSSKNRIPFLIYRKQHGNTTEAQLRSDGSLTPLYVVSGLFSFHQTNQLSAFAKFIRVVRNLIFPHIPLPVHTIFICIYTFFAPHFISTGPDLHSFTQLRCGSQWHLLSLFHLR